MLIAVGAVRSLGAESGSWLRFGEGPKAEGSYAGRRLLYVRDRPAFELSYWCGTCPFLFQRLEGATERGSIAELSDRLGRGLSGLDEEVIDRFASLLPHGSCIPILLQVQPRLVMPVLAGDYFAEEQVETWGVDEFWGLPSYPHTPYYRTFQTPLDADNHLYEFVVPMVPPSMNNRTRVEEFTETLASSDRPTAVAVSVLDICQPVEQVAGDYYAHWGLVHFLLDGHHKMQAAAETGRPLRLLALLSVDASLALPDLVAQVPELRSRPPVARLRS